MKLLIDLGNSRLKWAGYRAGQLIPGTPIAHGREIARADLTAVWQSVPKPTAVHIASVLSPARTAPLHEWVESHWGVPVVRATSHAEQAGVRNGYEQPGRLGVDRWLALIGAWTRFHRAVCVVDCGSAVTVDILNRQAQHLGGVIAPGLRLMAEALATGTDLPAADDSSPPPLGRDTHSALAAGRLQAVAGLIERVRGNAPVETRLVLTGGDAHQIAAQLAKSCDLIPDLVLEGLAVTLDGA